MADHIEQFFTYEHLPPALREISAPFCSLAQWVTRTLPRNPERTVALRKILEAKDAAVRAVVAAPEPLARELQTITAADVGAVDALFAAPPPDEVPDPAPDGTMG